MLAVGSFAAGRHAVTLEGAQLPPGLFFVRMQAAGVNLSRRVVAVR